MLAFIWIELGFAPQIFTSRREIWGCHSSTGIRSSDRGGRRIISSAVSMIRIWCRLRNQPVRTAGGLSDLNLVSIGASWTVIATELWANARHYSDKDYTKVTVTQRALYAA